MFALNDKFQRNTSKRAGIFDLYLYYLKLVQFFSILSSGQLHEFFYA